MRGRLWAVVAAATLLGSLAGCTAAPTPSPTPSVPPSTSALAKVGPGDCLGALNGDSFELADVAATSCTGPHNWEVSEVVPVTGEGYPGEIDLKSQADQACASAFTSYLGAQPGFSRYTSSYLVPDEAGWADPTSRRVVCLVGAADQERSESIKGDNSLFPEVGECTTAGAGDEPPTIVPCSTAHEYEAYADKKWTGSSPPTQKERDKLYTDVCVAAFTKFVGIDVGRSTYEIAAFIAPEESWDTIADHRIVCTAGSPDGKLTGSLKGSKK